MNLVIKYACICELLNVVYCKYKLVFKLDLSVIWINVTLLSTIEN